jgi:hypothetical protein
MQPPPRADPGTLSWTSLVWVARAPDGRQTSELVSLSQMSRAFRRGELPPDVEVAIAGEWHWENIRLALARHASLAPPGAADERGTDRGPDSLPDLELTLTVQRDSIGRSAAHAGAHAESGTRIPAAPAAPSTMPPGPQTVAEFPRRWPATPSLREVFDSSFATPLPARLASLVYAAALAVAAAVVLVAIIAGLTALFARMNEASEPRMETLAVLVGLGWVLGGLLVAAVVVILGRAAAGMVLVGQRVDERLQEERERRE